jgi:hypothetical protein
MFRVALLSYVVGFTLIAYKICTFLIYTVLCSIPADMSRLASAGNMVRISRGTLLYFRRIVGCQKTTASMPRLRMNGNNKLA